MARIVFELAGFFFLPFLAYAGFLIYSHKHPRAAKKIFGKRALLIQSLVGLVIVAGVLMFVGLSDPSHVGPYSPAVFKDGKLVPGRVD